MSEENTPDGLGLDKAARNELNREKPEEDEPPLTLEPPFPYSMIPFSQSFFDN